MATQNSRQALVRRAQRSDPNVARRIIDKLLPEAEQRHHLLEILAGTITHAHRANPASWSLTLGAEEDRVVMNVGRTLGLRFKANEIMACFADGALRAASPNDLDLSKVEPSKAVPGTACMPFRPERFEELWPQLAEAHLAGIETAAKKTRRTPYFPSHSPGVLDVLDDVMGREVPRPEHGTGGRVTQAIVGHLVERVRETFPQWDGFAHPDFVEEEIAYKRRASSSAQQILGRSALEGLMALRNYDEIVQRLRRVANSLNLLYLGTPSTGDLAVLDASRLDPESFCQAFFDLLHGDGDSSTRLEEFSSYLERQGLPNKWTFPTYFLFLLDPQHEFFVKPSVTRWFLSLIELKDLYAPKPTGEAYGALLVLVGELAEALEEYGPKDLIDVQSLLYSARSTTERTLEPQALETASSAGSSPASLSGQPELSLGEIAVKTSLEQRVLERWVRATERKQQAILYGPPGTGKTHVARLLARHLVGGGDGIIELVQFHPSTSYEDFIQGIRPVEREDGGLAYPLRRGQFLDFCDRARDRDGCSVLIIDEINRAELSRVFGELMFLLEYRDHAIRLAAGGEPFSIPSQVRILGTMNTADRSIALVDHALRRRFAFLRLEPQPDILRTAHDASDFPVESLIEVLDRINREIGDPRYALGVTYFLAPNLSEVIGDVWRMEIEPYLEEFFFDRPQQVETYRWHQVRASLEL